MSAAMVVTKTGLFKMSPKVVASKYRSVYVASVGAAQARAVSTAKSRGRRAVSKSSGIKLKTVKGRVTGQRYKKTGKVVFWYHWSFMPAEALGSPRQTRRGVKAGKMSIDSAFLIDSTVGRRSGKQTVVKRTSDKRLPLRRQGIDPRQMDSYSPAFRRGVERGYLQTYDKRLEHEMNRRLRRAGLA